MASTGTKHDFLDPPNGPEDHLGTLGHYQVIDELGRGGMGFVFLAKDSRLERDVALKVMNQKIAATPGSRKRFISEARAMAAVHHDNVATIFEVGQHNGTPFMAMELLEGSTLENFRERNGEPDFHLLITFAHDIARGLAAAHAQGIVHRDIKPANMWLDTKTNRIKILDFGLALAQTPVDQLSGRGAVVGTPGYLSPEQARSEPLDDRSDLYSTGVVLYELATGSLPLKSKTVAEQLIAILVHPPQPLRERNEKIPQPLADLIHKLMAKEPRDRYRSASELDQALEKVAVECESKTEVAQAINQLQLGLEQAVNKKKSGLDELTFGLGSGDPQPNPFESIPDALPPAAPIAGGVSSSGVHAAIPVASASAGAGASARRPAATKQHANAAPTSNSKVIWIAVGIGAALLLLLIPAIVFMSDSSAIARQQREGTLVIAGGPNPASGSPAPKSSSSNQSAAAKNPKPQKRQASKSAPSTRLNLPDLASPLITKVNARAVEKVSGPGAKWILGKDQGNGSFEQGKWKKGQRKLPGWTAKIMGSDAGWGKNANANQGEAQTFAYAGQKSELLLTSDKLKHQTKAGDIFRVSVNVGGEGEGTTDYRIVLGFQGDTGPPIRYEIADLRSGAKWGGGNQKRLQYEYAVDAEAAGKNPFLELTVSNVNGTRRRAKLDRVVLTVQPKSKVASQPKNPSGPGTTSVARPSVQPTPKPDPTMVASKTKPNSPDVALKTPPAADSQPARDSPPAIRSRVVREETLTTSDKGGADATVRSGASVNDPLGGKPTLVVQTRNAVEVQHVYLRFPLLTLREAQGGPIANRNRRGGGKSKPLPVATAELRLSLTNASRPADAVIRVYALGDIVSDDWPERKIAWSISLSDSPEKMSKLDLVAEHQLGPGEQTVVISEPALAEFIAKSADRSVTLILTSSDRNALVTMASKENGSKPPPTLVLGLTE